MKVIRPVESDDLEALLALAEGAGVGLTSLPTDGGLLRERIRASQQAFERDVRRPKGESYLFVLQDLLTGEVVGTTGMVSRVGGFEPFYFYRLVESVHASEALGVERTVEVLNLQADHKGPTEIGTLFLRAEARGGGNGRLLSLARFLFLAAHPHRFAPKIVAEMRGQVTADGSSLFWEAVGRHFFDMSFAEADAQSAQDKQFIADLMPRHPIYIPMLPSSVQEVIGKVHAETRPALRLLRDEGFVFAKAVDIFDSGPMLRALQSEIRCVRESQVATLRQVGASHDGTTPMLISNERLDFRCVLGGITEVAPREVEIPRDLALALGLHLGDPLRYVPARAPAKARAGEKEQGGEGGGDGGLPCRARP